MSEKNVQRHRQVERLYPRLLGIAARNVNYSDAGDVVHDVIVRLFELPDQKVTTDSWILKLTVNRTLNFIRDNMRRAERQRGFLDETHGHDDTPETHALVAEQTALLEPILDGLKEEDLALIHMRFGFDPYEEMSIRAISDNLGIPRSTVQDRLSGLLRTCGAVL
jgi:RNA polymerase sigma factor (sigma-70 family)